MEIYKIQAEKATCNAQTQRVLREQAQAKRVKEQLLVAEQQASPLTTPTSCPDLEIDLYPDMDIGLLQGTPIISQDKDDNTSHPAEHTHQQCQLCTLTQDYMLHMMEIPGYTAPFSPRQAASRTFPLQFPSVILHMHSWTMTQVSYLSTATSSSIQNTRTLGVTLLERKSDG